MAEPVDYSRDREEIGAVETAADFFKRRAGNASPEDLRAFLALTCRPSPSTKFPTIFASGANPHRHADDRQLSRRSNCGRSPEPGAVLPPREIWSRQIHFGLVRTISGAWEITPEAELGTRHAVGAHKPRALRAGQDFSPPRARDAATPHRERADSARQRESPAPTIDVERKRPRPRSAVQTALGRPRRRSRISALAGRPRNLPTPIHAPRSAAPDYPPNQARHRRPCAVSTPENRVGLRSSRRRSSFPGPQSPMAHERRDRVRPTIPHPGE